jgi:hypothetical protein
VGEEVAVDDEAEPRQAHLLEEGAGLGAHRPLASDEEHGEDGHGVEEPVPVRAHASTQTTVTLPDASSVHVAPTPHESGCDGAASMHAHVGVEAHDAGTAAHVYVSAGTPLSGGAMPGG